MRSSPFAISILTILSACGGGGDGNPVNGGGSSGGGGGGGGSVTAHSVESGQISDITYDAVNDTLTFTNLPLDGVSTPDRPTMTRMVGITQLTGFDAYESDDTQRKYFAVYASSALIEAGAVGTGDYIDDEGWGGAQISRTEAPTLPSGSANYSGDYAAVLVLNDSGATNDVSFVTGTVSMQVDFLDFTTGGSVEGYITNRMQYDVAGNYIQDLDGVSLGTGTIDADGFVTPADEQKYVEVPGEANPVLEGNWQGMFAGPNGEELAGIVVLTTTTTTETGVFATTRDAPVVP